MAIKSGAYYFTFIRICNHLEFNNQHELVILSVEKGCYDVARYLMDSYCGNVVLKRLAETRIGNGGGGILHCIKERILITLDRPGFNWYNFMDGTLEFIGYVLRRINDEIDINDCHSLLLDMQSIRCMNLCAWLDCILDSHTKKLKQIVGNG